MTSRGLHRWPPSQRLAIRDTRSSLPPKLWRMSTLSPVAWFRSTLTITASAPLPTLTFWMLKLDPLPTLTFWMLKPGTPSARTTPASSSKADSSSRRDTMLFRSYFCFNRNGLHEVGEVVSHAHIGSVTHARPQQ